MKRMAAIVLVLGFGTARAESFYMKAGAGDWSDKTNFYADEARTVEAARAPAAGDDVYLIGGVTYTASDADADSFAVFASLNRIWIVGDGSGNYPILAVTVAEGEKSVAFSYLHDTTGTWSATYGTLVKYGAGTLAFSRNTDYRFCHANLDVREGTVKLPQGEKASGTMGFLTLAAGTTLYLVGNPSSAGGSSFAGITAEPGSLMTNASTRANTFDVYDNPNSDREGDNVIAARVGGNVRPWSQRNIAFLHPSNTFPNEVYVQGNVGNLYSVKPWKNVGVYSAMTIGGSGLPSSLGKSSSIVFHSNGGGVRYLGSGERAARKFSISNTTAYPEFLDGGPNGNLEWTGDISLSSYIKNVHRFFFIGTNRLPCVWSGALNALKDDSGDYLPMHITKAGSGTWRFADNAKRYHHGGVTIAEGTLAFDSIANKGEMCALGYSDRLTADDAEAAAKEAWVDYAFTLGGTNEAGLATQPVFAYAGTSSAEVTNRPIALAYGGGTLRGSENGGYLGFAGISARDAGATPTLTLDGSSAVCGVAGRISDGAANARVSVAKTGAGTWSLAGGLTFSGDLSVKEGTLNVVGARSKTNTYYRITIKGVGNGGSVISCRQFALYDATGHRQNIGLIGATNEAARTATAPAIVRKAFDLKPGEAAYGAPLNYQMGAAWPTKPDSDLDGLFPTVSSTSTTISHQYNITAAAALTRDDPSTWVVVVLRLRDDCPPITHFDIQQMGSGSSSCPRYVTIEGSSDGYVWQTLYDNTETGFDLEGGSFKYNPNDKTMCCYCLESGHVNKEEGCSVSPNGAHVVVGWGGAPAGVNGWVSMLAYATDTGVNAVRTYEEGVRCFAFTGTAELDAFPVASVLPNVSYVSAAAGATLDLPDGTAISKLRVDATGAGTIRGAAFAEKGTLDILNLPADPSVDLPGAYANCAGLAHLAAWTVTKDGAATALKIRVSGDRLRVVTPGMCLIVR